MGSPDAQLAQVAILAPDVGSETYGVRLLGTGCATANGFLVAATSSGASARSGAGNLPRQRIVGVNYRPICRPPDGMSGPCLSGRARTRLLHTYVGFLFRCYSDPSIPFLPRLAVKKAAMPGDPSPCVGLDLMADMPSALHQGIPRLSEVVCETTHGITHDPGAGWGDRYTGPGHCASLALRLHQATRPRAVPGAGGPRLARLPSPIV